MLGFVSQTHVILYLCLKKENTQTPCQAPRLSVSVGPTEEQDCTKK